MSAKIITPRSKVITETSSSTEPEVSVKECDHMEGIQNFPYEGWEPVYRSGILDGTSWKWDGKHIKFRICPLCGTRLLPDSLKSPSPDAVEVPLDVRKGQDSTQADKTPTIH